MKLSSRILLAASVAAVLTAVGCVATVYVTAKSNRIAAIKDEMAGILAQADNVIESMDRMYASGAFDTGNLLKQAKEKSGGKPLKETYRGTAFYDTIPVVSAWKSVEAMAEQRGFEFTIPTKPGIEARNARNDYGREYVELFEYFESGEDLFVGDRNGEAEIVAATPVKLRESCLSCHGNPSESLSGDGLDVLGFPMENMRVGEIKGAFVLRAKMDDDAVVAETVAKASGVGAVVLVLVLGTFYIFNKRYITNPVREVIAKLDVTSQKATRASVEVSQSSNSLANGASEQAATIEQTASSLETLSQMTHKNTDSTKSATETASEARSVAEQGVANMKTMVETMNTIKASSDSVSNILKTIDEIAFQTNILALNAAVEAARAGDAGTGFAVVADEVRNLAHRSAKAANETSAKLEESIANSEMGVKVCETVGESLSTILNKVALVDEIMNQISQATGEQGEGIAQINVAIRQMNQITQQNASDAEQTAAASTDLSSLGLELGSLVGNLSSIVDGQERRANASLGLENQMDLASSLPEAASRPPPKRLEDLVRL
ncbi:methyl-accepting chemotaxis protein [Pelagicoccus mobilis]|uniref:DUF3365 domain-containing protein n=1 Tax=Pelagicoccus mobilis TaxID=415221 RepID=A0A934VQE7_9BACT|nr:methyl-accepting chemotaxis protein [Pelagicoccus mobilis]MBK1878272.1 DUF3365 domain-containing protein [Pelagicoccus mobilis]